MNSVKDVTELTKQILKDYIKKDSICVDGTIGNGNDTLFLCLNSRFVYGFDIQQLAIDNTEKLLKQNQVNNYRLILDSHDNLDKYIDTNIDIAMFNLGYLPTGDKKITTLSSTSLSAIQKSLAKLNKNGLVCVVLYYGHDNGKKEREVILDYVKTLNKKIYHVGYYQMINQENDPPEVLFINKK